MLAGTLAAQLNAAAVLLRLPKKKTQSTGTWENRATNTTNKTPPTVAHGAVRSAAQYWLGALGKLCREPVTTSRKVRRPGEVTSVASS